LTVRLRGQIRLTAKHSKGNDIQTQVIGEPSFTG
jgi:hypothetical protein